MRRSCCSGWSVLPARNRPRSVGFGSGLDRHRCRYCARGARPGKRPLLPNPKPLVDKLGDPKPVKQLGRPRPLNKPEITTPTAAPPAPQPKPGAKPEPKPETKAEAKPEPKPDPKPEPKPDPKAAEKPDKKPDDFKPDKIAELLKNNRRNSRGSQPQDKPTPDAPKYNANQIAELLDHREPQRQAATGGAVNRHAEPWAPRPRRTRNCRRARSAHSATASEIAGVRRPASTPTPTSTWSCGFCSNRTVPWRSPGRGRGFGVSFGPGAGRERQARVAEMSAVHDAQA